MLIDSTDKLTPVRSNNNQGTPGHGVVTTRDDLAVIKKPLYAIYMYLIHPIRMEGRPQHYADMFKHQRIYHFLYLIGIPYNKDMLRKALANLPTFLISDCIISIPVMSQENRRALRTSS